MERHQDKNRVPANDPSKAMDSKREVEQSNDPKTDQDFPGYPHYPAKEDIMDQRTDMHRVDMDVENLAAGPNRSGINQRFADAADKGGEIPGNEEELQNLDSKQSEIGTPHNVSNDDLSSSSIPGTDVEEEANRKEE